MWGADSPAYPDISFDPPRSSVRPGFAPEGFTAGPETFVNPEFWRVVRSYDIADPANPYTFKKYVAYNRFRWINDDSDRRQSVFRDDGTAPREAAFQGSTAEIWGTVPSGLGRAQRQLLRQQPLRRAGPPRTWPIRGDGSTWTTILTPSLVERSRALGPGRTRRRRALRYSSAASSDRTTQTAPIEMPDWFRI